ncbi:hypothetical protein, partial [Vibrio cholerae]|uniref:hypothetical protein n=1 Tax=Vibrio cholerae TaxID=666 RepID=UPI003C700CF3
FYAEASHKHTPNAKSCEVGCQNSKRSRLSWPRLRVRDKESKITAMMQPFVKPNLPHGTSNNLEASRLVGFQRL